MAFYGAFVTLAGLRQPRDKQETCTSLEQLWDRAVRLHKLEMKQEAKQHMSNGLCFMAQSATESAILGAL